MTRASQTATPTMPPAQAWPADGKQLAEVSNPYGFLPVTEEILAEIVRRIVAQFNPEKIILFGSYAYGKPHQDSDVDLFVVMHSVLSPFKRAAEISTLIRPRPFPVDIVVRTHEEMCEALVRRDPFVTDVMQHGRVLYERLN